MPQRDMQLTPDPSVRRRVVAMSELTASEVDRWRELRRANPALDSPYFHPGFAAAVAATRCGVAVVVGDDEKGVPSSFLAVQLDGRTCRPAGFPAADFQGPICAQGSDFDVAAALAACGASVYQFDHMREGVPALEPWIHSRQESPFLEVTGGMEGYLTRASRSGKDKVAEARRLSKRAERDLGAIRLVTQSSDPDLLDMLIALKRRQYTATGARDYFADDRHRTLLHHLLREQSPDFGGILSGLYAGEQLLAAHFGLRAGSVLHWWFPVYHGDFGRLSPGWMLLSAMIAAAPDLGVERIDLGRGMDDYKRRAMTGQQVVCQGAVIPSVVRRNVVEARRKAIDAVRSSPVAPALRNVVHYARRRGR